MSKSKQNHILWVSSLAMLLAFALIGTVLWLFVRNAQEDGIKYPPVLQSLEFDGGDRFHLYQTEVAPEIAVHYPAPARSFLSSFFAGRPISGRGGYSSQSSYGFSQRMEYTDSRITVGGISSAVSGDSLGLMVRMENSFGSNIITPRFDAPWQARQSKGRSLMAVVRDSNGDFDNLGTTGLPWDGGYRIEVENGYDGWLKMIGPIVFRTDDGRALCLRDNFPRLQSTLNLRVHFDGETKVVSIPNPAYGQPKAVWKSDATSWRKNLGELDLELTGFQSPRTDSSGRKTIPLPTFAIYPSDLDQGPEAFIVEEPGIYDETGNFGVFTRYPGVQQIQYRGLVKRSMVGYIWKPSQVTPLLEYEIDSEGVPQFTLLPKAKSLFYNKVNYTKGMLELSGSGKGGFVVPDFSFLVNLESNQNSKLVLRYQGGGESGSGGKTEFDSEFKGEFSSQPGMKGTIGFAKTPIEIPYIFTLDIDDIEKPVDK